MWTQWVLLPCSAWALMLTAGQHLVATLTLSVWEKGWTEWLPRLSRGPHCQDGHEPLPLGRVGSSVPTRVCRAST